MIYEPWAYVLFPCVQRDGVLAAMLVQRWHPEWSVTLTQGRDSHHLIIGAQLEPSANRCFELPFCRIPLELWFCYLGDPLCQSNLSETFDMTAIWGHFNGQPQELFNPPASNVG